MNSGYVLKVESVFENKLGGLKNDVFFFFLEGADTEQCKDGVSHLLRQKNLWIEWAGVEKRNQLTFRHSKFELTMSHVRGERLSGSWIKQSLDHGRYLALF